VCWRFRARVTGASPSDVSVKGWFLPTHRRWKGPKTARNGKAAETSAERGARELGSITGKKELRLLSVENCACQPKGIAQVGKGKALGLLINPATEGGKVKSDTRKRWSV